jgi:hypothetical protein
MKDFFALFAREIRTIIMLFPVPLFVVLGVMCTPLSLDFTNNRVMVSIFTFLTNLVFYIPPFLLILSFQRDIRTHFGALTPYRVSGARIMLCKYLAALTLGLVISLAASIWPYQENSRAVQGIFQMKQAGTGYLLLTFRYFLNVLFFSGLVCLAEGLQFTVKRRRELVWAAVFLGGTGFLFLPGKALYTPLFAGLTVLDGFILMSGAVFFLAGLVFFHRKSGVRKGAE